MTATDIKRAAAQMVMPRINGHALADPSYRQEMESLVREGIGGFILFGGDIENTPRYLSDLQASADIPVMITSDVERGLGQQLVGGTRFPNQRAVASAINMRSRADSALLNRMLDAVRIETRAAGIHAIFSPVMDVNNNPENPIICTRSFGEEPAVVEWFGSRYIERFQMSSVKGRVDLLACAKHFPGHGDTDVDSHSALPVIHVNRARLNRIELPPFREAVKKGVGMVMIAHLLVPALDPEKPVTFSKKIVTALLREGMEFGGLIVSDALDMGALANDYPEEEIAVRAVEAGMDILLHPKDARKTIEAIVRAVVEGRLTRQRIQESVDRIIVAKRRLGLFDGNLPAEKSDRVGDAEQRRELLLPAIDYQKNREIARELCRKAVRVISGKDRLISLNRSGAACFVLDDDAQDGTGSALMAGMMKRFALFSGIVITPSTAFSRRHAQDALDACSTVVIAIFSKISASKGHSGISAGLKEAAHELIGMAKSAGKRSIVISFDSPYILDQFRDADVLIAGYDRMDEIQQAAAELL